MNSRQLDDVVFVAVVDPDLSVGSAEASEDSQRKNEVASSLGDSWRDIELKDVCLASFRHPSGNDVTKVGDVIVKLKNLSTLLVTLGQSSRSQRLPVSRTDRLDEPNLGKVWVRAGRGLGMVQDVPTDGVS